ncbi:hypothetical protein [Actinoplanes hulinensis]|nr:hypothetical protein [Actinoplanes hulinensis]
MSPARADDQLWMAAAWTRGRPFGKWQVGEVTYEFKKLDRRHVLGPGTGWDKAFDLLRALAAIHGDDGVRLVVGFVG